MIDEPGIAERMDAMRLAGTSNDEQVRAVLHGQYDARFSIAPGHAERVGEQRLAEQLGQAARSLFNQRAAEIARIKRSAGGLASRAAYRLQDEAFFSDLERVALEVPSTDRSVTLYATGLKHFTFTIAAGSIARIGSDGIVAAADEIVRLFVPQAVAEIRRLRREHYAPAR